ncbi:PhzF family phenazine biosynthesis protein [soil metagenome]
MSGVEVIRVFTDGAGGFGNPLGIIDAAAVAPSARQALAQRLGYSETVFVGQAVDGVVPVQIFTPSVELAFAGHPSVGTAWWLARRGMIIHTLAVSAGDVAVRYDGELTWITADPSWAPEFTFHALESAAAVDAVDPHHLGGGHHYFWAWQGEGVIRSRMCAPGLGIVEDEATGAAAVRLTGLLQRDLEIHQGLGSILTTTLLPSGSVELGGRCAD